MNRVYIILAIGVSALITFALRAFPFLLFGKIRTMPEGMEKLGKNLPAAIMAILIVYCLRDAGKDWFSVGIPELAAVLMVAATYKWKHNTLLSILAGTVCNMVLLRIL